MPPQGVELKEKVRIRTEPTIGGGIELHHPAAQPFGIKLHVPGGIEGIGETDPTPIATHFDHLRAAIERCAWPGRLCGLAHDPTEMDGARELWVKWIGHVVLARFTGTPARHI